MVPGISGRTVLATIFKSHWDDRRLTSLVHAHRLAALRDLAVDGSENWTVMVDEAHRTQEKDLGAYLCAVLPQVLRLRFTGTPVKKGDKDTFQNIGVAGQAYLDKYGIDDAVAAAGAPGTLEGEPHMFFRTLADRRCPGQNGEGHRDGQLAPFWTRHGHRDGHLAPFWTRNGYRDGHFVIFLTRGGYRDGDRGPFLTIGGHRDGLGARQYMSYPIRMAFCETRLGRRYARLGYRYDGL